MKRYGQRCPAALALDVIGERWTPLIVRELLVGPKRYTDLIDGLPGIGTNVLAGRLSDLQTHGIIEKRTLPPPTPVAVYELTEAGQALAPVIRELRAWGSQYGPAPEPGDAVRPAWILSSAVSRPPGLEAGRSCEIRIGNEHFALTRDNLRAGSAAAPDATVTLDPSVFLRLAVGRIDVAGATAQSEIAGDPKLAGDVLAMLAGAAPAS